MGERMTLKDRFACKCTVLLTCLTVLLSSVEVRAAELQTIGAHGVSLAYDPRPFASVRMLERAAKPAKPGDASEPFSGATALPAHLLITVCTPDQRCGGVTIVPTGGKRQRRFVQEYPRVAAHTLALEQLLNERPKIPEARTGSTWQARDLPTLRFKNAGQTFLSKVEYLTFGWGSAVAYLSQYAQDASDWAIGYNLSYEIHGLTSDGAIAISAEFDVGHRLAPGNEQKRSVEELTGKLLSERGYTDYLSRMERLLGAQPNESFQPPLNSLQEVLNGIEFYKAKPRRWHSQFKDREITLSPK